MKRHNDCTSRGVQSCALDLVGIVVDSDEAGPRMARQIAHRPANTAANIEHVHTGFQGQPFGEKMLMSYERRLEALAPAPGSEVKGLAPAELVEVGHQVVVAIHERAIMLLPALQAGVVDFGVSIDRGLHFAWGEIREGARFRSCGRGTIHGHILPESHAFPKSGMSREAAAPRFMASMLTTSRARPLCSGRRTLGRVQCGEPQRPSA